MRPNTTDTTESRFLGGISASSIRNLLPRSMSSKHKLNSNPKVPKYNSENTPPVNPNIQINGGDLSTSISKQSPSKMLNPQQDADRPNGPNEPSAAPVDLPLKVEVVQLDSHGEVSVPPDPPVKVMVRIRPTNDGERKGDLTVKKLSSDSLSVGDRNFTFDSVFDADSKQEDIFQSVGVPLVKNALAGYNTSILSYGQTGSGKTYTMWGPPSAMVEEEDLSGGSNQGIVPRIFQMLFSEIQKEHDMSEGKQINYQCRCSFLEIYNEQVGDLLDPTQRNLETKNDTKNGLYLENLTEEYVTSYEDVIQILIKGLSSRKVGATTINSKSSRSHIVFNFIIESWCKETSSKCFGSSKTSRISLIDLAGLDQKIAADVGRQLTREAKLLKKSLSHLGHLVNALARQSKPGRAEDVLYRGSCLTRVLQESLGGNAKLTVICAISQDKNHSSETLRTLRFGQRLKFIKNEPVINKITEDDVNDLSDQIRQLKEELIRAKSTECSSIHGQSGYFQGRNVRESLNQLRVSLNRSLILPPIDNDSDIEVNFNENDVRELRQQLDKLHTSSEENSKNSPSNRDSLHFSSVAESFEADSMSEDDVNGPEQSDIEETNLEELPHEDYIASIHNDLANGPDSSKAIDPVLRNSISIIPSCRSPIFEDPPMSESPKIGNLQRKSFSVSNNKLSESSKFKSDKLSQPQCQSEYIRSSLRSNKIFQGPAESLAASLQRGLKIIDNHQRNSASNRSLVSFSFEHLAIKASPEESKSDAFVQTQEETRSVNGPSFFLCASCQQRVYGNDIIDSQDNVEKDKNPNQLANQMMDVSNAVEESIKKLEFENLEQCKHNESMEEHGGENHSQDQVETMKENCEMEANEKEALLKEIQSLRSKLQSYTDVSVGKSTDKLRSSMLLSRSMQLRKSSLTCRSNNGEEELERERQRWMEMESDWISLTDELRIDLESYRRRAENVEMELNLEKKCKEELDDALYRAVLGHGRIVEHYAELQEKYNDLAGRHRAVMEGIAEVKRAAEKAGSKGHGSRFAKSLAAELSSVRRSREKEREFLKKENKNLKIQLRDTAEAVHAAGELLARLREAEHSASVAEENYTTVQQENEKLRKQMEKMKTKHKMEMATMKQYLADSRLPTSALQPLYREDSDIANDNKTEPSSYDDDQAWRAEFGAIYQNHY